MQAGYDRRVCSAIGSLVSTIRKTAEDDDEDEKD
jgi:hypothetical protein